MSRKILFLLFKYNFFLLELFKDIEKKLKKN